MMNDDSLFALGAGNGLNSFHHAIFRNGTLFTIVIFIGEEIRGFLPYEVEKTKEAIDNHDDEYGIEGISQIEKARCGERISNSENHEQ